MADSAALKIELDIPDGPRPSDAPRELREVIPAGRGRIDRAEYIARIRRAQRSGMQSLMKLLGSEHSGEFERPSVVCIVGGGPSLCDEVAVLRRMIKHGAKVLAVNKSHDWLLRRGLRCDYAALLDPKPWVASYIDLRLAAAKDTRRRAGKYWASPRYLIASQCDDLVLKKFSPRRDSYLWHAAAGLGESDVLKEEFAGEPWVNVAGASVIGLRAVGIAHGLGFRSIHLFGIDGSMKPCADPRGTPALYAYDKPHIDATWRSFEVKLTSGWTRAFTANHHMARSVYEFEDSMREWDAQIKQGRMEPFSVRVHGDPEYSAIAMVAAGTGVAIPSGRKVKVFCDGADCVFATPNYLGDDITESHARDLMDKAAVEAAIATSAIPAAAGTVLNSIGDTTAGFHAGKHTVSASGDVAAAFSTSDAGGDEDLLLTVTHSPYWNTPRNITNADSPVTASDRDILLCQTVTGVITVNLPGSGRVQIIDVSGAAATNNITVDSPSGDSIMDGAANENMLIDINWFSCELIRRPSGTNWSVS